MLHVPRLAVCSLLLTGGCGAGAAEEYPLEVEISLATCDRQYDRPLGEIKSAILTALQWSGFGLSSERCDELGGEWVARRPDGPRITVIATSVELSRTSITIRIDPGNGDLARFLGERLTEELGKIPIAQPGSERSRVAKTFAIDVRGGLQAGERTCQILDLIVVQESRTGEDAQLDALTEAGSTVQMLFTSLRPPSGAVRVTFTGGAGEDDDNPSLASQMSVVFAKQVMTLNP